jgi:glycosyltransferase XagB
LAFLFAGGGWRDPGSLKQMLALGYCRSYIGEHNWELPAGTMAIGALRSEVECDRSFLAATSVELLADERLDLAVNGLRRSSPNFSASGGLAVWQSTVLALLVSVFPLFLVMLSYGHAGVLLVTLPPLFLLIVLFRAAALGYLLVRRAPGQSATTLIADKDLPTYSVLVPLYREGSSVPGLVEALRRLDYPHDKLEIFFVIEAADDETAAALLRASPSSYMRIISVPAGQPQTKPRALSYALQFAKGTLVTVYDAEDEPDIGQLRLAAQRFIEAGPSLGCLQARLSIFNPDDSFLTRQFTIEYAALFEAILPLLQRLGLPILLGGTSNHFRRSTLDMIGGWDPFNVTEDADLGVRLSRYGFEVAMLDSDTWEEAPSDWLAWRKQRSRWLKGWIQTYAVHMRGPRRLLQDLGFWRFFGFQVTLGGMILSALVHPWFYFIAGYKMAIGQSIWPASMTMWSLCVFNLLAGYSVGVALAIATSWRSPKDVPAAAAVFVPLYWLAISIACYWALFELHFRPFHWNKTPHRPRPAVTPASRRP